jgi:hypothetical protein
MIHPQVNRLGIGALIALTTCSATLLAVRARAAGIPDAAALTYTGYLENPDGTPVAGKKSIGVSVYDAETDGNEVCALKPADVEPVAGRFQLALPEKCTMAVKGNPILWVEVEVEGALLGRTKLGAVPYAIEAAHATTADSAESASSAATATGAAGALKTTLQGLAADVSGLTESDAKHFTQVSAFTGDPHFSECNAAPNNAQSCALMAHYTCLGKGYQTGFFRGDFGGGALGMICVK